MEGTMPDDNPTAAGSTAASQSDQQRNQIDFQFLNFSHPSEAKASRARRTVRSHVTRQQHQREHAAAAARRARSFPQPSDQDLDESMLEPTYSSTFPPPRPTSYELPGGSSSGLTSSPELSPSPSPLPSPMHVPEGRVDPGEMYPEQWQPYITPILDNYINKFIIDIPDLDEANAQGLLRTRFFPFLLTDRASFHAMMLLAVPYYNDRRGPRSHPIDLLQLRGMAISEINGALEEPVRATSDQIIAAVALMASYEALFGDYAIFNTHMTGLLRMVSLRGGLPALGLDGLLERIILWIDSNAAHITGSHLYFDKAAFPSAANHPRPNPERFRNGLAARRTA